MRILLVFNFIILFGCQNSGSNSTNSSPACSGSQLIGTWTGTILGNSDTLNVLSSCQITSTYCNSFSTMSPNTAASGNISVTVGSNNGNSGCLGVGTSTCAYQIIGSLLTYNCGGGVISYTRSN